MLSSYPALFYYDDSDLESVPFFVTFPDFENSGTQGENISDALFMASDWLGIVVADYIDNSKKLPKPSRIQDLSLSKNNPFPEELNYDKDLSFISMVYVDVTKYVENNKLVKKTLSIPKWADNLGKQMNINYSQTLTNAIANMNINK